MNSKQKKLESVFIQESNSATRIGFAGQPAQSKKSQSLWHDVFFGLLSHSQSHSQIHLNQKHKN